MNENNMTKITTPTKEEVVAAWRAGADLRPVGEALAAARAAYRAAYNTNAPDLAQRKEAVDAAEAAWRTALAEARAMLRIMRPVCKVSEWEARARKAGEEAAAGLAPAMRGAAEAAADASIDRDLFCRNAEEYHEVEYPVWEAAEGTDDLESVARRYCEDWEEFLPVLVEYREEVKELARLRAKAEAAKAAYLTALHAAEAAWKVENPFTP